MRTALLPASLLAAALALPCAAPAHASILVTIDKTTQRMSIAVDGATRYVWPVSTGRPGYDTPNGTFRPFRMEADHFSKEWDDAPMPHSVFFTKIGTPSTARSTPGTSAAPPRTAACGSRRSTPRRSTRWCRPKA
jgi:L,D-transpeptidase catalytic domain